MKIQSIHPARQKEDGMATMMFAILLAIMVILVTAESRALYLLHCDIKFVEQQQIKRLNGPPAGAIATTTPETK